MNRREFLDAMKASGGLLAAGVPFVTAACAQIDDIVAPDDSGDPETLELPGRNRLPVPETVQPTGLTLSAQPGTVATADGGSATAWMYRGSLPGPTLRLRSGDTFRATLENGLGEETIIHWHGLDVPELADGHPRLAVGPGGTYAYEFTVRNRAGTYWYHPHPHGRTAIQTYRGLAGFLIVDDGEDEALGLPTGAAELPLLIQDKRLDSSGAPVYQPAGLDVMTGYLGNTPFVNGVAFPYRGVTRTLHRLRILNGSNARIYDLALSDGTPLVLIGTDGGLLDAAESLDSIFLSPAERVDVLVDFSGHAPDSRVLLQSRPFQIAGGMGMGGGSGQGQAMDLMEFVVLDGPAGSETAPSSLASLPAPPSVAAANRQTFQFTSMMGRHLINGRSFEMERVDARIPLGTTEVWRFVNSSPMPHPVHMHAGHFRILSRSGGRSQVFPWERGFKDTVLLLPFESVEVAVPFEEHRGLYLLHCHNLEHEDAGMMLNFEIT